MNFRILICTSMILWCFQGCVYKGNYAKLVNSGHYLTLKQRQAGVKNWCFYRKEASMQALGIIQAERNKRMNPRDKNRFYSFCRSQKSAAQKLIKIGKKDLNQHLKVILIGIDKYQSGANLNYAKRDADKIEERLINEFKLKKQQIIKIVDSAAIKKNIERAIKRVVRNADKDDVILIAYSGHGFNSNNTAHIMMHDYNEQNKKNTSINHIEFNKLLGNHQNVVMIIDACHSGAAKVDSFKPNTFTSENGRVIIASSLSWQLSAEPAELRHGVLTYYLLQHGITKKADVNHDGIVTISEIWNGLSNNLNNDGKFKSQGQIPVFNGRIQGRLNVLFSTRNSFAVKKAIRKRISPKEIPLEVAIKYAYNACLIVGGRDQCKEQVTKCTMSQNKKFKEIVVNCTRLALGLFQAYYELVVGDICPTTKSFTRELSTQIVYAAYARIFMKVKKEYEASRRIVGKLNGDGNVLLRECFCPWERSFMAQIDSAYKIAQSLASTQVDWDKAAISSGGKIKISQAN